MSHIITNNHFLSSLQLKPMVLAVLTAVSLTACQTNPALKVEPKLNNKLQIPQYATQVPEKLDNIRARDKVIYQYLADAEAAWVVNDFDQLDNIYLALAEYDPGNLRASEGKIKVQMARNHATLVAEAEVLAEQEEAEQTQALEKLHRVLLENPQHSAALPLYNQLLQKQEQRQREKLVKKLAFNQPVTMEFRDVGLKQVFESLSKTTKINFVLDKDIPSDQKMTMFVKNMAFRDALDLLLQTNQLEKKVIGDNSVIIYVNDILHQRDYKDLVVRSFTLDYADAKQMSTVLRNILGIKQMEVDARLNTLIIKDSAEVLQIVEKMILAQDLPDAEVMLEMQVMEVTKSNTQDIGVNPPKGVSVLATGAVLTVKDLDNIVRSRLGVSQGKNGVGLIFDESVGDINLLANPRIRVKNKEVAKIHIGEKVPVFTANVASTGVTTQTVQYIDAGLKLEVEPQISPAGDVTIKLNLNVGSIGKEVISGTGQAFRVGTRLTSTVLRLHDGETQVLAGLIDDQDRKNISGLPGLSSFPIIGRLFGARNTDKTKTEIVLAITPRIIRERKHQTDNQAEMWIGSEGQMGKRGVSPAVGSGLGVPFIVPKPPSAQPASKAPKPENMNIPLPAGFSLGTGLEPGSNAPVNPESSKPMSDQ